MELIGGWASGFLVSREQISFYDPQDSHFMTDKFHFMTELTNPCGFGHKVKLAY